MGQSPCFGGNFSGIIGSRNQGAARNPSGSPGTARTNQDGPSGAGATGNIPIITRAFTYYQLQKATKNFSSDNHIGEGGSAHVFKGKLRSGQDVAVKQLKPDPDRNMDYDLEVRMLSRLSHPNIINMIGCCADGSERMIVYEFIPLGSLFHQLYARKSGEQPLDWDSRMKIAAGVAKALSYLHNEANPRVIYRDLKPSNILLGDRFHPKLSEFGIAKSAPQAGHRGTVTNAGIMGTPPYWALEHALAERFSFKSDVYSFGVVLLEIIFGSVPLDDTYGRHVADWKNFLKVADAELLGQFPEDMLKKAMKVVSRCVNLRPASRPDMSDVVRAMDCLAADPSAGPLPAEFSEEGGEPSSSTN